MTFLLTSQTHRFISQSFFYSRDWKRRPSQPHTRWVNQLDQIRRTNILPAELWRRAIRRGRGAGATQRLSLTLYTCICTLWIKNNETLYSCPQFRQILTNFQTSFTVRLSKKLAIKKSLKIPPHLKCVATLPCEVWMSITINNLKQCNWLTINFNKIN